MAVTDQRHVIVWSCQHLREDHLLSRLVASKRKLPLMQASEALHLRAGITLKCNRVNNISRFGQVITCAEYKGFLCLNLPDEQLASIRNSILSEEYLFIIIEGASEVATVILRFSPRDEQIFSQVQAEDATVRLDGYDLPPTTFAVVDSKRVRAALYSCLAERDPDLFSVRAQRFLRTPHILTRLFSQVMSLESKKHINFISVLKVLADHFRGFLEPCIKRINKDHHGTWAEVYGDRVSFLDGGMSRIVSLPGTEPMGIRVGIYTVTPGETDLSKREEWFLRSFVIGDVIGDRRHISGKESQTDTKRLQEAARYILEPLTGYDYIKSCVQPPRVMFIHGPLQNSFQTYDEQHPFFIPGVNTEFLASHAIEKCDVISRIDLVPKNHDGDVMWNGCIAVYLLIMKYIFQIPIPVVGVVERSRSRAFTTSVMHMFAKKNIVPKSTRSAIWNNLQKYEIGDELLFGCILDEGEYIEPLEMRKNLRRRAHEKWKPVVDQFPPPMATMLKCSEHNFPFRVEFSRVDDLAHAHDILCLLYHTSLLLPHYSFPVGVDIADKYAKIPDWLSKGISERLTATVLRKVLETGDDRMLRQVRRLLALSPRDFFFRPKM